MGDGANDSVLAVCPLPDGRIIVGGSFSSFAGVSRVGLARLQPDGQLDLGFSAGYGTGAVINAAVTDGSDNLFVAGTRNGTAIIDRLKGNGSRDAAFAHPSWKGSANALCVSPGGGLLVGGNFAGSSPHPGNVFRLLSTGSIDPSFAPGSGPSGTVLTLTVDNTGGIWVAGSFLRFNGMDWPRIARLDLDGSLSASFLPDAASRTGGIRAVLPRADGGLWVAAGYQRDTQSAIQRLLPDGSLAPEFVQPTTFDRGIVQGVAVAPGGEIYASGLFDTVNGLAAGMLVRLQGDGQLDPAFQPGLDVNGGGLGQLSVQQDGSLLTLGTFTRNNAAEIYTNITRFLPSGQIDPGFRYSPLREDEEFLSGFVLRPDDSVLAYSASSPPAVRGAFWLDANGNHQVRNFSFHSSAVTAAWPLSSTEAILVGTFTQFDPQSNPRYSVVRVHRDSGQDMSFQAPRSVTGEVRAVAVQADGTIMVGGIDLRRSFDESPAHLWRLDQNGAFLSAHRLEVASTAAVTKLVPLPSGFCLLAVSSPNLSEKIAQAPTLQLVDRLGNIVPDPFGGAGFHERVRQIAQDNRDGLLVTGELAAVNSQPVSGLVRLKPSVRLRIGGIEFVGPERFRLKLTGPAGSCRIEQSSNLRDWETLTVATIPAAGAFDVEQSIQGTAKWYRLAPQ